MDTLQMCQLALMLLVCIVSMCIANQNHSDWDTHATTDLTTPDMYTVYEFHNVMVQNMAYFMMNVAILSLLLLVMYSVTTHSTLCSVYLSHVQLWYQIKVWKQIEGSNQFIGMKPDWRVNPELREKPDTVNVKPYKNMCLLTLVLKALLFIPNNAIFNSIHSHHNTTHVHTSMYSLNTTKYMWHRCPLALCMKSQVKMAELFKKLY